ARGRLLHRVVLLPSGHVQRLCVRYGVIRGRLSTTLLPYTTLFRSLELGLRGVVGEPHRLGDRPVTGLLGDEPVHLLGHRAVGGRSEEHTSELQSRENLVCRLLLEKKNPTKAATPCSCGEVSWAALG